MNNKMVPIAIVGIGTLIPGSNNILQFWRNVVQKKNLIKEVPSTHWLISDYYDPDPAALDKTYCKHGAFLDPTDFDYREFGIPPNNLSATDSNQLLSLVVAKQVLDDATNGNYMNMDLSRVSVILGITVAQELAMYISARLQKPILAKTLRKYGIQDSLAEKICETFGNAYVPWQENTFPGLLGNIVAGRIANRFNLGGTNCTVDAACASAIGGLAMAANELALNKCDMAITGGADTLNDPFTFVCFSKTPALSTTGDCRPFSQEADGTLLSEGLAFFALKRLEDAERDGQHIYAVIRGIGSSSDGRSKSIYAPAAEGQAKAILNAYQAAGYSPATVELIEAHGTATKAGDVAEFNGLRMAFQQSGDTRINACAIGSIKSQIGHAKGAAGAISLLKTIMALHHKILPPTLKVKQVNSQLEIEKTPFYLNTETRPWIKTNSLPRRASVSSFGFGGSNFHVAVEEYVGHGKRPSLLPTWKQELVVFSAATTEDLLITIRNIMTEIFDHDQYLTYIARKSQLAINTKLPVRLAIVANSNEDFKQKLIESLEHIKTCPDTTLMSAHGIYYAHAAEPLAKVAYLFPGQGSQYVNMGREVTLAFSIIRNTWDELNEAQSENNLAKIVFPHPSFNENERIAHEKELIATQHAQPALGITNLALFNLMKAIGVKPDYVAGHSFGEISALCAAGVYNSNDMLSIAKKRGEIMATAGNQNEPGAMLAVICTQEILSNLLQDLDLPVSIANYNSPQQVTLTGPAEAIDKAYEKLKERKITCHKLSVSGAFHSKWMASYGNEFLQFLQTIPFNESHVPVYSNVTGKLYEHCPDDIKHLLAEQLFQPVQFQKIIESMYQQGVRIFIEVGPSNVLSRLTQESLQGKSMQTIALDKKGEDGIVQLWHAFAKLFIAGLHLDFDVIWSNYVEINPPVPKTTHPYSVKLTGTTYGKPYPGIFEKEEAIKPEPQIVDFKPNHNEIAEIKLMDKKNDSTIQDEHSNNDTVYSTVAQNQKLQLFERFQQQTLDAQNTFQNLMFESHMTFLKTNENTLNTLLGIDLQESPIDKMNHSRKQTLLSEPATEKPLKKIAMMANNTTAKQTSNQIDNSLLSYYDTAPAVALPQGASHQQVNLNVIASQSIDLSDEKQIQTMLLKIISEKTGYPVDMLNMDMTLEADLGIDSIKRVEILAGLQQHLPNMPEADPTRLSNLKTLNEIVRFIVQTQANEGLKKKS